MSQPRMLDMKPWVKKNEDRIKATERTKRIAHSAKGNKTNPAMRRVCLEIPPSERHIECIKFLTKADPRDKLIRFIVWRHQFQVMPRHEYLRCYIEFFKSVRRRKLKRMWSGLDATFITAAAGHSANILWVQEYSKEAEGQRGVPARGINSNKKWIWINEPQWGRSFEQNSLTPTSLASSIASRPKHNNEKPRGINLTVITSKRHSSK